MADFQALYDHSQFQEMKVQFKDDPEMYQRYVQQRVRYINERERERKQFMQWCTKEVIEQSKEIYPDEDHVQLVTEIVSGLTQLFMNRYESITDFSLEINF